MLLCRQEKRSNMNKSKTKQPAKTRYHHGDLHTQLITTATDIINQAGVDALSLRKLAEKIGVSRTAAYHHFKDKNDLLCAIAAQGFIQWRANSESIFQNTQLSTTEKYRQFVHQYVHFATNNPSLYELMFGSVIWKSDNSTQSLRNIAYPSFQYQLEMTKLWQQQGLIAPQENSLRLAQVTWATLHGIARLLIDGIYADTSHIDEMCECVVRLFTQEKSSQ
jgi:AcrR family transcriptional regulator